MSVTPYWADDRVTLYLGDCIEVLAGMESASVDAIVTDPPYGLEFMGREWDGADGFRRSLNPADADRDSVFGRASRTAPEYRTRKPSGARLRTREDDRTNPREGKSSVTVPESYVAGNLFQEWCTAWAAECLRVLRPGGHLLAFGGTRTYHRLACGIEDAGFEIRDSIHWIYGSGFPKSLDVSKAIDKRAEENVETKRRIAAVAEVIRSHREAKGMTPQQVSLAVVGTPSGACWNWEHQQLPSAEMWPAIKRVLGIPGKYDGLIEGDRARFIAAEREVIGERRTGIGTGRGSVACIGDSENRDVTAPATDDATRWEGWGTALKPSHEPIVVARKPLAGIVAQNVVQHGTGALNIDGCRIPGIWTSWRRADGSISPKEGRSSPLPMNRDAGRPERVERNPEHDSGRWPPNVVLGPEAAAELDRQSGVTASRIGSPRRSLSPGDGYGMVHTGAEYEDSGGASRFFPVFRYEAKAGSSERPRGEDGTAHPTVKPVSLISWLARLVTPPGGTVLDPFGGSGTTAEACIVEGFRCVLVEKDPAYAELIRTRLRKPIQPAMFGGEVA